MRWELSSRTSVLRVAVVASIIALLVVTVGPIAQGPVQFSPQRALEFMSFLALLWATVFAAENLREIRTTRELEYAPILHLSAHSVGSNAQERVGVKLHNVGRGPALDVALRVYIRDDDNLCWVPVRVSDIERIVAADTETGGDTDLTVVELLANDEPCDFVAAVSCRDAFWHDHTTKQGFKFDMKRRIGVPVAFHESLSPDAKLDSIRALAAGARKDPSLVAPGCRLDVQFDRDEAVTLLTILPEHGETLIHRIAWRQGLSEIDRWLRATAPAFARSGRGGQLDL